MTLPMLETPRLRLRPPVPADLEPWAAMMADEETARFIGSVQTRFMVWRSLMAMAGSWALNGYGFFSVIEKATGRWIGRVGPWHPEGWPAPEIAWGLVRPAWGQGYAAEAATAAIDWTFAALAWPSIAHVIHRENARSQALARRLGAERHGAATLPPPFDGAEADLWVQDRARWRARRRP